MEGIDSWALSSSYEYGPVEIEEGIKELDYSAFYDGKITSVLLPSTLISLGKQAFLNSTITSISTRRVTTSSFPDAITTIPDRCFQNCASLSTITFTSTLETLGQYAFSGCTSITQITFPSTLRTLKTLGQYAFSDCTKITQIKLPTTVTLIDDGCFSSCSSLQTININELSITTLHRLCFNNCTSLNGVQIPTTVTIIENYCFNNCSSWSGALNLPSNLTSIGYSAFKGCKSLTGALTLPSKITYIGDSAFKNCSGFTSLTFNCNISTIEYSTFQNCSSIANTVIIPSNVTSIGYSAFSGCKQIKRFNFQTDNAPSVGTDAFSNGYANVQIWIPKYDGYASYRDALNSAGFVDRKTGSGAIMHSNDYRNLNNSNGQYDHDLARYYDGRWRKVLFCWVDRETGSFSTGYGKLLSVNASYVTFMGEQYYKIESANYYWSYYEILEGYSYKVEVKTGNKWGKPMASWYKREVLLYQIFADSTSTIYSQKYNSTIKTGDNFYGNYDATSYCDISPSDYGLQSLAVFAQSS